MTFIDRLDMLLKKHDLNKNQLAAQTGIPVSTIYGWYKKGYEGITLPTVTKLAEYFNCTIEYLVNGETLKNNVTNDEHTDLNESENTIINLLNSLNEKGQQKVIEYALDLHASGLYSKDIKEKAI